jgi:hypothetical protein
MFVQEITPLLLLTPPDVMSPTPFPLTSLLQLLQAQEILFQLPATEVVMEEQPSPQMAEQGIITSLGLR